MWGHFTFGKLYKPSLLQPFSTFPNLHHPSIHHPPTHSINPELFKPSSSHQSIFTFIIYDSKMHSQRRAQRRQVREGNMANEEVSSSYIHPTPGLHLSLLPCLHHASGSETLTRCVPIEGPNLDQSSDFIAESKVGVLSKDAFRTPPHRASTSRLCLRSWMVAFFTRR